jgi:hypothetical protein
MATSVLQRSREKVDAISVVAYPYQDSAYTVTPMLKTFSWRESAKEAAVEGTFTFHDPDGFARKVLAPGTWLLVRVIDPLNQKWTNPAMHFYVWERGMTDRGRAESSVVAFDIASFLQRVGSRTWVFKKDKRHRKGWTASQIAREVLREFEIQHRVVETAYKIPFVRLTGTPLEVITAAYTEDRAHSGVKYRIRAVGRRLFITRLLVQQVTWEVSDGTNLIAADWSESLEGVATSVRAVTLGDNNIPTKVARVNSPTIPRYGLITETIQYDQNVVNSPKRLKQLAAARLRKVKKLERKARIEAEGIPTIRATDALVVADKGTGLKGKLFVETVEHSISAGEHRMSIDLSWVAIIPTRALTPEERRLRLTEEQRFPEITYDPQGRPVMPDNQDTAAPTSATGIGPQAPGAMPGGDGGNWGGSMERAKAVEYAAGIKSTSDKRGTRNTADGGVSDHWTGKTNAYAVDLWIYNDMARGDQGWRKVWQYLANLSGNASYATMPSGAWQNVTIQGYRYNCGWRVGGHFDHIHVGIQRTS